MGVNGGEGIRPRFFCILQPLNACHPFLWKK
jgi:hypothetical protein